MYKILKKQKSIRIICLLIEIFIGAIILLLSFYGKLIHINFELTWQLIFSYAMFVLITDLATSILIFSRIDYEARKNHQNIEFLLGADISESYLYGQIGMIYFDNNRTVMWTSELFEKRNILIHGENIIEWLPDLILLFEGDIKEEVTISLRGRNYNVICINDMNLLIFKDVTDLKKLIATREHQAPVIANIVIDNLSELNSILEENIITEIDAGIRKIIGDWAKKFEIVIRKYRDDSYFAIFDEDVYRKILNDNFQVANLVRNYHPNINSSLTISIGIGRGSHDIRTLAELANSAIDIALSRGGDQIVVNNYSSSMEFYGGKTTSKARRNLVKSRTLTQSLIAHIKSNKTILIMGHKFLDMDAIGACLGIYALAKKLREDTFIIYDEKSVETKAKRAVSETFSKTLWQEMIITPAQALNKIDNQTIVVLVDCHSAEQAINANVLTNAEKIAIIDHHRKMESAIEDPVFSFMDPSASSTCELVAEILKYSEYANIISEKIATVMLSGILLDTNYYRSRTSSRTFESSAILKDYGASSELSDDFLKDEYEEYLLKAKIMNNVETPYYGIVVASAGDDIVERTILAKVAQEILSLKEIRAVFVIGNTEEHKVSISSRSNGTVNVQLLMEKMDGGGHFNAAATQMVNTDIIEGKKALLKVLSLYLNDACIMKGE